MATLTFWTILFVLALILLLEGASLSPPGRFHKVMVGGLYFLAVLVFVLAGVTLFGVQGPTFSGSLPTYFLGAPS